jgi:hypothetical protein
MQERTREPHLDPAMLTRRLAVAVAIAAASSPLEAQVMNFDSFANYPGAVQFIPSCYTENGFTLTAQGEACGDQGRIGVWGDAAPANEAPATAAFTNYGFSVMQFTKQGGGPFSLTSVDLFPIFGPNNTGGPTTTVRFVGTYADNTTTTQDFTYDNTITNYFTATLDNSFTNLQSASLQVIAGGENGWTQFDNVTFNGAIATPEPASLALVGTGLIALGSAVRRRRKTMTV